MKYVAAIVMIATAAAALSLAGSGSTVSATGNSADCTTDGGKCPVVDLREALGPVRFQDDKSWCYAFTTADLLTYRFQNELHGERVSDVYTALTYTHSYALDPYSDAGGMARLAIKAAYKKGFCPQKLEDDALRRGPLGSLNEKLQTLRMLKSLYDRGDMAGLDRKLDELAQTNSIVISVPREDLMRALQTSSARNFPLHFADLLCGDNRYKPTTPIEVHSLVKWVSGTSKMMKTVDEQLTSGNVVGIAYYSAFLLLGSNAPQADKHLSVLVGRRWNEKHGECEYLIRNSFGPQCLGYSSEWIGPDTCQAGHIWIPRRLLEKNLRAITYIEQ
ncbi:MAG TPA: hypothetical protein VGQ11_03490 [Candidatus Acidoferrales bacterium]|nr:hypothetical protein [Candidatus Acidoferrales bacterium]